MRCFPRTRKQVFHTSVGFVCDAWQGTFALACRSTVASPAGNRTVKNRSTTRHVLINDLTFRLTALLAVTAHEANGEFHPVFHCGLPTPQQSLDNLFTGFPRALPRKSCQKTLFSQRKTGLLSAGSSWDSLPFCSGCRSPGWLAPLTGR